METSEAIAVAGSRSAGSRMVAKPTSYNLNGQKLGRKGRDTRDRILAATNELLAGPPDVPLSLSAVAREASLGMTSLYAYFNDLTELLLAVLEPVMTDAEAAYLRHLYTLWPDDGLFDHCLEFMIAFHDFWQRHSRILHYRNSVSDAQDKRMMAHRVESATRIIRLLVRQMRHDPMAIGSEAAGMATVLYTGIERIIVVSTDQLMPTIMPRRFEPNVENFLRSEARLLEFGIRTYRATAPDA